MYFAELHPNLPEKLYPFYVTKRHLDSMEGLLYVESLGKEPFWALYKKLNVSIGYVAEFNLQYYKISADNWDLYSDYFKGYYDFVKPLYNEKDFIGFQMGAQLKASIPEVIQKEKHLNFSEQDLVRKLTHSSSEIRNFVKRRLQLD